MIRNIDDASLLYSVGTKLAYKINNRYYKGIHYVWVTDSFNSKDQPPTSNPCTIIKRYLEQISSGDRHAIEINNNKAGILRGAKAKLDAGIITKTQYKEIGSLVSCADYRAFFPILYIMETPKVLGKCKAVPVEERASDDSFEYKITDLANGEYQVIDFESVFSDLMRIADKKVGD